MWIVEAGFLDNTRRRWSVNQPNVWRRASVSYLASTSSRDQYGDPVELVLVRSGDYSVAWPAVWLVICKPYVNQCASSPLIRVLNINVWIYAIILCLHVPKVHVEEITESSGDCQGSSVKKRTYDSGIELFGSIPFQVFWMDHLCL